MKKMAVHSGSFHADDVFAVALMQGIYNDLEIIRTRKDDELKKCDIVADVGGGKYDHHCVDKKYRPDGIPYCAFGLLWQDFYKDYIEENFPKNQLNNEQLLQIKNQIALNFITLIDAHDNGIDIVKSDYKIMTLPNVIDMFVPINTNIDEVNKAFFEAVKLAKKLLYSIVEKEIKYFDDFNYIKEQLEIQNPAESHILILNKKIGYKKALLELDKKEDVLFVIFEDLSGKWMVQNVQISEQSFVARKDLPKSWAGLNNEDLDKVTGVDGCVFCHPARFLCGNKTKEGAIELAQIAVTTADN
ncbi:hypothetical protein AN641_02870 [Candidatus Epulonipiscioides gigas]|nr:hypothetical protein AN641_02870 [Epulopiscium sp. SCG-C07WGA-EpuloA2]